MISSIRSLRDVVGVNFATLTHPDDVAGNVRMVEGLSSGEPPLLVRKRYLRPEASAVQAHVHVSRLRSRNGSQQLVGTVFAVDHQQVPTQAVQLQEAATRILAETRMRAQQFRSELFADRAWEILLEVYLAESEARLVRPDELSERFGEPIGTIWRWLRALEEWNLIEPVIEAAFAIQLTSEGFRKIERQLTMQTNLLPSIFNPAC